MIKFRSSPKRKVSIEMSQQKIEKENIIREKTPENRMEEELESLLQHPSNKFLTEIPQHVDFFDHATTSESLQYAHEKINARILRTFHLEVVKSVHGITPEQISATGMNQSIERVLQNAHEIGRGGDAYVVIDKAEIQNLPPEICYKIAIKEETPRGRNETFDELKMHSLFYSTVQDMQHSQIGVPEPFYAVEIGNRKVIAMEKLNATSIDMILRGRGMLPGWINIDILCTEIRNALDILHNEGLYHRDMHLGNIMISQTSHQKEGEKMAYIIDFGLSSHAHEDMEPYKKEMAGNTFTYSNDYAIIDQVRDCLSTYRKERHL